MKLTDYIDTPSVRVFQHFAGESLENLNEAEAWDVVVVAALAASMASTIGEQGLRTKCMLERARRTMDFTRQAVNCIEALDQFPINKLHALVIGFISIGFEVESQPHPVVIAAIRMLQEVLGEAFEQLDEGDAWTLIAVIAASVAITDPDCAVDFESAKEALKPISTIHPPALKAVDALKGLPKELAPQFIVTFLVGLLINERWRNPPAITAYARDDDW